MDEALIFRFYECFKKDYSNDIPNNLLGIANLTFQQVFDRADTKYSTTTASQQVPIGTNLFPSGTQLMERQGFGST